MAHSLSSDCTPLKHEYDNCFNAWFEGYLQPAVALNTSGTGTGAGYKDTKDQRAAYSKQKADEFNNSCGKIWEQYRGCVQKAVREKGLDELLLQARVENPLVNPDTRDGGDALAGGSIGEGGKK
ncbi:hypothetical protein PLICRDRAFT_39068 [Plicaturopsis crispa FD-325 SS-3]|nr:hypothetical protein PLICRDRAFT_39068 [Plicaturopsis crispa FD-325 SS-3]